MAHVHTIYDSDLHFVIDPVTRVITNQSEKKNSLIQFDHNSERFTFELPRYIEEHDMLVSNRVEVHYVNIDSKTGTQSGGVYDVRDLQVSPHDDNVVICSWLVSNNATQYAGTLNFVLRFACTTGDTVDYVWNTAVFKNYMVQNGLYNSDPIVNQYPDVIAQWYQSLFTASADGVTNIAEAKAAAIAAVDVVANERIEDVEQTGRDVIASLPADYVELAENVAPAIVDTAKGAAIAIKDSANRKLRGLTLYGKSTQNGTPTPETPVEIESVESPTVRVYGGNLVDVRDLIQSSNKTLTVSDDGYTITAIGGSDKAYTNSYMFLPIEPLLGKTAYLIADSITQTHTTNVMRAQVRVTNADGTMVYTSISASNLSNEFTVPADATSVHFGVYTNNSSSVLATDNTVVIQGFRVTLAPDVVWESPQTPQTISTARTLPGITVTSGGNYTDEHGQQWICDEVDFERGVYVQRVANRRIMSTDNWATMTAEGRYWLIEDDFYNISENAYCTHFARVDKWVNHTLIDGTFVVHRDPSWNDGRLSFKHSRFESLGSWKTFLTENEVRVIYELATPIETPLTTEEIAAYTSLRSNYPNTSVLNDSGAGMSVSYVADTKLYIDRKLSV